MNKHFKNEYNIHDLYLDEKYDTIEDFERYYSDVKQLLPGKDVFDKPFIDDIIIDNFKGHKNESFEWSKITVKSESKFSPKGDAISADKEAID